MTNSFKKIKLPGNLLKIFYLLLPLLAVLKAATEQGQFAQIMVLLIFLFLAGDFVSRLIISKGKAAKLFSIRASNNAFRTCCEHAFWITLTCLVFSFIVSIQVFSICLIVYSVAKTFSYIIGKRFVSGNFFESTIAESIAFFVLGTLTTIFVAINTDIKWFGLLTICGCLIPTTVANAREKLLNFNTAAFTISVFMVTLAILDGIWKIFS